MSAVEVTRQELYEAVWQTPMTTLAKQYGLSYKDFKKICKDLAIPLPKAGYWTRIRAGKEVPVPALPSDYSGSNTVTLPPEKTPDDNPRSIRQKKIQEIIESPVIGSILHVPDSLRSPHKLITIAQTYLEKKPGDHKYPDMHICPKEVFDVRVSKPLIKRALLFMDTLIKILEKRGHKVQGNRQSRQTEAVINGEAIPIRLVERLRQEYVEDKLWGRIREYRGKGELVFQMDRFFRKEWCDNSKMKLEEYLPAILIALEEKSVEIKVWHEQLLEQRRLREEEEKKMREEAEKRRKEKDRFEALEKNAQRWARAEQIRSYIDAVENQALSDGNLDSVKEWLQWARAKADWLDPLKDVADPLLDEPKRSGYSLW